MVAEPATVSPKAAFAQLDVVNTMYASAEPAPRQRAVVQLISTIGIVTLSPLPAVSAQPERIP